MSKSLGLVPSTGATVTVTPDAVVGVDPGSPVDSEVELPPVSNCRMIEEEEVDEVFCPMVVELEESPV